MPEKPLLDVFSSCLYTSCVLSQGFVSSSNSLFCGLFFQMMPIKGKGKVSKQTNKLASIVSGASSIFSVFFQYSCLLAAEPFFAYRVLMISKQRISKQTKKWGVYLIHLIYCFYWKEKLRLTWRHSSVQCHICCRSNTSPDCLSLTFVRVGSAVWAAFWVVKSVCGVSDVNHHQPSSFLRTITGKILWELSLRERRKHRCQECYGENEKKVIRKSSGFERKQGAPRVESESTAKGTVLLNLNWVLWKEPMKITMWITEPKSEFSLFLSFLAQ